MFDILWHSVADFTKVYTLLRPRTAVGKTNDQRETKIRIGVFQPPHSNLLQDVKGCRKPLNRGVKFHNQTRKPWKATCEDLSGYLRDDDVILDDIHTQ